MVLSDEGGAMQRSHKTRFAYRYGLRRAWLLLSVLWISTCALLNYDDSQPAFMVFWFGVAPSVLIYALAAAVVWVVEGFGSGG